MSAGGNKHSLTPPLFQTRSGPDSTGDGAWQGALDHLLAPPLQLLDLFSLLTCSFSLRPTPWVKALCRKHSGRLPMAQRQIDLFTAVPLAAHCWKALYRGTFNTCQAWQKIPPENIKMLTFVSELDQISPGWGRSTFQAAPWLPQGSLPWWCVPLGFWPCHPCQ